MKTKLVLWGTNSQEERILIAMQLHPEDNKVTIWTFPETVATEDFSQKLMREWRNGVEVEFPEEHAVQERGLSMTEGLLPDDLKVERGDVVQRAQTEWHFVVLSSKLNKVYQTELDELKERVEKLEAYDQSIWDSLKEFWTKVQGQVRERNLFRDHSDSLRDNTNILFSKMKQLRSAMDDEFREYSKEQMDKFMAALEEIEKKVSEGLRLQTIFEELKKLQRHFREAKLTREHRTHIWERLDGAFKLVKEKRFGAGAIMDRSPMQRLQRRYDGLIVAIEKMDRSIRRDKDDLEFQQHKIDTTDGQLEAQIRKAKIKMIEERIHSKEEKLGEMNETKEILEKKIESQKEKDARRDEQVRREAAKKAAKEKIAEEIKAAAVAREEHSDKLEKAAEIIATPPQGDKAEPENLANGEQNEEASPESVSGTLSESLEDVVDTIKAVAEVVSDKIGEAVEDLKAQLKDDGMPEKQPASTDSAVSEEEE